MSTPPPPSAFNAPPPSAFAGTSAPEAETPAAPAASAGGNSLLSTSLNDRWKQYEPQMDTHRSQSSLGAEEEPSTSTSTTTTAASSAGVAPRQPYSFKKSSSYNTDDLIRKYGGIAGVHPGMTTPRVSAPTQSSPPRSSSITVTATDPLTVRPADVRSQAQRVLDLVDDKLYAPVDIQRTQSGGFRAAPIVAAPTTPRRSTHDAIAEEDLDPFSMERTTSGRRVPKALSGLNMGAKTPASPAWNNSGRYSFSDPSFRDDDHISDEEDDIVRVAPFHDEPVVDVASMENRSASARPYSDNPNNGKQFEGDYSGGSKAWSSRYTDASAYTPRKNMMEQWDREFEENQKKNNKGGPLIMFMGSAKTVRSSARSALSKAGDQKSKIFGSGGFSFRSNHVFGRHKSASDSTSDVNLRSVWKEVDEDAAIIQTPRHHKTWQEVMLNKRKRRRILAVLVLLILGAIAASSAVTVITKQRNKYNGPSMGSAVTFYVTSDTPYDSATEESLSKDLVNIPMDSEFVVHLGNIQQASVNYCPNTRYSDVASVLKKSPVPLFIVPGEEDWTKCPSPPVSFLNWKESFYDFDLNFKHAFDVKRDDTYREAFCFLHRGVLFMGLHVVGGPVYSDADWEAREKEMLRFYFGMSNFYKGKFRSVVLLGNARPSPQQHDFFTALFSNLESHHAPVSYIHANQKGDTVTRYNPFEGHEEVEAISVQDGSEFPPLKITVGFGEEPITIG